MRLFRLSGLLTLLLPVLLSCQLAAGGGTVTTNSIIYQPSTNWTVFSNAVMIISNYQVVYGTITLTNCNNESRLQPTFMLAGTLSGDLAAYIPDGTNHLTITVTNSGYSAAGRIVNRGSYKEWTALVYQETLPYIFTILHFTAPGWSDIYLGLNFYISNIPAAQWAEAYDGRLTNSSTMTFSGTAWLTQPAAVSGVTLWVVDEDNTTNTQAASLSAGSPWTNTVQAVDWSAALPLSYGVNQVWGLVSGDNGLSYQLPPVTVTRALVGVDGIRDPLSDSAPLLGSSTVPKINSYLLGEMRMTNDAAYLYLWIDADNVPDLGNNGARIALSLDTNTPGGTDYDAWSAWSGRFTLDPLSGGQPDYQIQFRIQEGGGQALYGATPTNTWTALAWNWSGGDMQGIRMAVVRTNGWELSLPLSVLKIGSGTTLRALCILSGNQDQDGVWDVIPEHPSNAVRTAGSNLSNFVEQVYSAPYTLQ